MKNEMSNGAISTSFRKSIQHTQNNMNYRGIILSNINFTSLLTRIFCFNNRHVICPQFIKGNNRISLFGVFSSGSIIRVKGRNNVISIGPKTFLKNCKINIVGSNCNIIIGENCRLTGVSLWMEDNGGRIYIGEESRFHGNDHIAVIEGTSVKIGRDCLFSTDVSIRTGDSHSILDFTGKRINNSMNVTIGNHVWVGNDVKILKGADIGKDSMIATGAIVTAGVYSSNVIIGGIGKVIKESINWSADRIKKTIEV